jgi:hypothetical protein
MTGLRFPACLTILVSVREDFWRRRLRIAVETVCGWRETVGLCNSECGFVTFSRFLGASAHGPRLVDSLTGAFKTRHISILAGVVESVVADVSFPEALASILRGALTSCNSSTCAG